MTLENCLRLLEHYERVMNDKTLKSSVRKEAELNHANMKAHLEKSKKGKQYLATLSKKK